MQVSQIIAGIDEEIAKLTEARRILGSISGSVPAVKSGRGRPKGSKNAAPKAEATKAKAAKAVPAASKRKLSPEGRKRIAEAMKRRWAERKVAAK